MYYIILYYIILYLLLFKHSIFGFDFYFKKPENLLQKKQKNTWEPVKKLNICLTKS